MKSKHGECETKKPHGCFWVENKKTGERKVCLCKFHSAATAMLQALTTVSFYARINHGTKCKDYGEIVDPVLKKLGVPTGEYNAKPKEKPCPK